MTQTLSDRRDTILKMLAEDSSVNVSVLARTLGVTPVTARADLAALEEEGLLVRNHGGAVLARHPKIVERSRTHQDEKSAAAKAAAEMIRDGDTVLITAGTTVALITKYLLGRKGVHIVTNNTLVLTFARTNPHLRVTLLGGEFRAEEEGMVGPMALAAMDQFHCSKAFLGIDGASVRQGYTAHFLESADLVRKMSQQAEEVVVVADSTKFGNAGFAKIIPFDGADVLVTDEHLTPEFEKILTDAEVRIVKANV